MGLNLLSHGPGRIYDLVNYSDDVDIVERRQLIRILIREQRSQDPPPDHYNWNLKGASQTEQPRLSKCVTAHWVSGQ